MLHSFFIRKKNELLGLTKKSTQLKRILVLENQPAVHSGAHYRVEILRKYLNQQGIEMEVHYPFNPVEFKEKPSFKSFKTHLKKKFDVIRTASNYDLIVVRRELVHQIQYGNLFLEKLLLSFNANVVLDMDDYMPDLRLHLLKTPKSTFGKINFYNAQKNKNSFSLFHYYTLAIDEFYDALKIDKPDLLHQNVHIFPMALDYEIQPKNYFDKNKVVGWLSQSIHFKRIDKITPYLNAVYEKYPFELHIVADKPYANTALNVPVVNKKWSLENEKQYMQLFDIGIAPIDSNQDLKSRKGTFKLIQYMALGVVSLTTYLTYCDKLVEEGKSGFLIRDESEWETKLLQILQLSPTEMNSIKEIAYDTFRKTHHIEIQANSLIEFYKSICQ